MWWPFRPKNTIVTVAKELIEGLEDGSVVLPWSEGELEESEATDNPIQNEGEADSSEESARVGSTILPEMDFSVARMAAMFAALAEPTRLQIAYHLATGPHHVSQLAELLRASRINVSHHLGIMRQAGLIDDEKHGRNIMYRFRSDVFTVGGEKDVLGILSIGPFRLVLRSTNGPAFTAPSKASREG